MVVPAAGGAIFSAPEVGWPMVVGAGSAPEAGVGWTRYFMVVGAGSSAPEAAGGCRAP